LYGTGSLVPSTATSTEYKEYGIGGGVDDPNIVADSGLAYDAGDPVTFIAGGVVLTAPQLVALNAAIVQFNERLGR